MGHDRTRRSALWLVAGLLFGAAAPAAGQTQVTFGEAVATLAQHRSAGEQGVALLKRYRPEDVRGRQLYALAKAAFDGVIGQMQADLASSKSPDLTPAFKSRLESAASAGSAFGAHVDAVLKEATPAGSKPAPWAAALLAKPAELIKALTDSGIAIWREAHGASMDRRKEMAARIEQERWRAFSDVAASK